MMKKWLISSAIFALLFTGVWIGTSTQKGSPSAQSQDDGTIIQKRSRHQPLIRLKRVAVLQNSYSFYWLINFSFDILHFFI